MITLLKILTIVGSLGVFLFGMKLMSESLQKVVGYRMRNAFSGLTPNRYRSFFTGLFVTGIIQSSSASTVMITSFVNAGLLSLFQAVSAILGANVGTTLTAWIIAILGFKMSLNFLLLPIIGIAIPFYFTKKGNFKATGELLIGFAFLFLGLELLKQNIPTPETSSLLLSELSRFTNLDFISILLFAIAGIILTIIIQSSSASFALILVMCHNGWIGLELSIAMILGMNLGTSSTAIIASLVANRSAKRAALAHLLFNLIGVIWGLSFFKYSIVGIDWLTLKIEGLSPSYNIATIPVALSLYHSLFNVLNATLLIFFVPQIIKVTELLIPSRTKKEYYSLKHLRSLISTSELTLLQARKLINAYGLRTAVMFEFIPQLLVEKEPSKYDKLLKQVHKYEDISDNMEDEIEAYLTHLSESELSRESSKNVYSMLKVIDNLENINDVCMKMSTLIDNKNKEKAWFTQEMRDELGEMFSLLIASLSLTNRNIEKLEESPDMSEVLELESKIDILRNVLVAGNNEKIQDKTIAYNTAKYFAEFVALCEKIGDLTLNINEALTEKV